MQGYGCGCVIWDSRKKQKEIKTIMRKMRLFPLLMAAAIAMSAASGCSAGNGGGTAKETGTKAASLPSSEAGTEDAGGMGPEARMKPEKQMNRRAQTKPGRRFTAKYRTRLRRTEAKYYSWATAIHIPMTFPEYFTRWQWRADTRWTYMT